MTNTAPRRRASALNDTGPAAAELQSQIQILGKDSLGAEQEQRIESLYKKLEAGHRIRQSLLESKGAVPVKDTFRHLNGFHSLITNLDCLAQEYTNSESIADEELAIVKSLLHATFDVLTAALQSHKGNQKYFRQRVDGGGWLALQKCLNMMLEGKFNDEAGLGTLTDKIFGCLLACALEDEAMTDFFSHLRRHSAAIRSRAINSSKSSRAHSRSSSMTQSELGSDHLQVQDPGSIHDFLKRELSNLAILYNPAAILVMFGLWKSALEKQLQGDDSSRNFDVSLGTPSVMNYIAGLSTQNLAALHSTGLLRAVLESLLKMSADDPYFSGLNGLAMALLQLGVANVDDACFLYRHAHSSALIGELLLISLKSSRSPSYVHFDLSLNGFASIELPGIGRAFPPTSSSSGYTLSLWFQMVQFDNNSHTTIFGAFDASQTCFVLVYLEKDTHNLILQTSVTSSRPSVRFKSASFKENRWYHVVIAHRRPKTTSSSRASLFIDGEFVEQVKSQYPATPPLANGSSEGSESSSSRKSSAIQAFLGTPQDLASQLGKGLVSTQWRLASANLFADVLSDDLIAVYYELGPRYTGNYQDCLGSFQTYRASAVLNLRNESLHPGKEEKSDILSAIRLKAGALLPESKMLLNISAAVVLDDNDENNIDETHLLKFISKTAGKNLRNVTRGGRNALAINGAIPSINEALLHSSGFAVLTGDPTVIVPQALDDAAWRIGGCAAVGLALFEVSRTSDEVLRALDILFESVQENWRNSEAMERENGFGVLSTLLNTKMASSTIDNPQTPNPPMPPSSDQLLPSELSLNILTKILKFVGYRVEKPEESVIINPLAYRILLVDNESWRNAEPPVQKLYYEQYVSFALRSKFHQFNAKRLARMRELRAHETPPRLIDC